MSQPAEWKGPRRLTIREESETSWNYGWNPNSRPLDQLMDSGVIVLDKQKGPTSHDFVATLKRLLDLRKAGHSGTLE